MKERNLPQRQSASSVPSPAATSLSLGQSSQVEAPTPLYELASQSVQDAACSPGLYFPATQAVHAPSEALSHSPGSQLAAMLE